MAFEAFRLSPQASEIELIATYGLRPGGLITRTVEQAVAS